MSSDSILVVGAGFAGAVTARILAEAGYRVDVIDKRSHIAGNAYDEVNEQGIRIHHYGPHLFHTNNDKVVEWLSRFTTWTPYEHRVTAQLSDDALVPLPINRRTLEVVFGRRLRDAEEAQSLLAEKAVKYDVPPSNAEDYLRSNIGNELTDLFFAPYTEKMWGMSLADMDAAVVKRIPIRFDDESRYFPNDAFQALPTDGYTALIGRILDHPLISMQVDCTFDKTMMHGRVFSFLCCPIDEFYEFCFGPLPYRSIRFHHESISRSSLDGRSATVNFTDRSPYTRVTYWHLLAGHDLRQSDRVTATTEEPCDYQDNAFERYYPVKTADGRFDERYRAYKALAEADPTLEFIGRCGTYQYLDMHQVVNQSILNAQKWLSAHPLPLEGVASVPMR